LESPHDIFVLDSTEDPLDDKKRPKEATFMKRAGRGHHHLPKIKGIPWKFKKIGPN